MNSKLTVRIPFFVFVYGCALLLCIDDTDPTQQDNVQATVDQVDHRFQELFYQRLGDEESERKARKIVEDEGLRLEDLRAVHLGRLLGHPYIVHVSGLYEPARQRLWEFLDDPGPDGATARLHLLRERMRDADDVHEKARLYQEAFRHPALEEAIGADAVRHIPFHPGDASVLELVVDDLLALDRLLVPELAENLRFQYLNFFEALKAARDVGAEFDLDRSRAKMVELARSQRKHLEWRGHHEMLDATIELLSGAAARNALLNRSAPQTRFLWSSSDAIQSLDDLQGNVVVLEFWASWCAPCIASFPKLRELQERYAEEAVIILGVTRVYGDEPERELDAMPAFIEEHDMTWPIVFAEPRFKHEFGVRAIPQIALIDATGVVRHADIHPADEHIDLTALIDELVAAER